MHQHIEPIADVNVWELHEPGEHYQTSSIETLRRYALAQDTRRVRLSAKWDGSEVEFRVDGPEDRLLWYELGIAPTPADIMSSNEICRQSWRTGKLEIVRN